MLGNVGWGGVLSEIGTTEGTKNHERVSCVFVSFVVFIQAGRPYSLGMRARLTKEFRFEAAHTLPSLPEGHKCRQMHGHSFKIEISIEGVVDETIGWVYDHKHISAAMAPLLEVLDHGYLNDIEGLESPTIERMAGWFWKKLAPQLPGLAEIVIFETPTARCSFKGEF